MRSSKTAVNLPKNRRLRGANIYARNPTHDSIRISQSFQVGFHIVQDMAADMPLKEMVKLLNQFNPDILSGFPSVICELAQEKLEKRLLIRPQVIFLGSEPLSSEMREIIRKGFGIDPHDHYGTTEAIVMANECPKHLGMHLEDDMHIIEVVDQNNQPVSHGEMGHKILVTNLYAFTQPIIRYELSDMIELDSHTGLCPCGRTFRRIKRIMGRNEDLFYFQNNLDKQVVISHEDLQQAMSVCQNVRQYQIIRRENEILVKALLHDATLEHQTKDQIIKVLSAVMQNMQVKLGRISCEFTDHLERKSHSTQKFRQIWCEKD
jgi:phenylacetate-coenzyme A ligase PaaK-like adenylate-forming protein